jgi:hypothetical protein
MFVEAEAEVEEEEEGLMLIYVRHVQLSIQRTHVETSRYCSESFLVQLSLK